MRKIRILLAVSPFALLRHALRQRTARLSTLYAVAGMRLCARLHIIQAVNELRHTGKEKFDYAEKVVEVLPQDIVGFCRKT